MAVSKALLFVIMATRWTFSSGIKAQALDLFVFWIKAMIFVIMAKTQTLSFLGSRPLFWEQQVKTLDDCFFADRDNCSGDNGQALALDPVLLGVGFSPDTVTVPQ